MSSENTASVTPVTPGRTTPRRPCALAVTKGPTELLGRIFSFDADAVIGRAQDAEIHVDGHGISRRHARLILHEQGFDLVDLQSKNGTFCNGDRVIRRTLRSGDLIQIGGELELRFSYVDQLDEDTQRHVFENATRDVQTGAVNRTYLLELLGREFGAAVRYGNELTVIVFEPVALDALPDAQRPLALATIARGLAQGIRAQDVVGRVSATQFAVVLRDCGPTHAPGLIGRLTQRLSSTPLPGTDTVVAVRTGVASYDAGLYPRALDLLETAIASVGKPPM